MARYDDLNTSTIGYLTFLSSVLLVVIILLLQALCYNWIEWQEDNKLVKQSYQSSNEMIDAQRASLSTYEKVKVEVPAEPIQPDGQGQTAVKPPASGQPPVPQTKTIERVHIPIQRAQELVLEELKASAASEAPEPST